MKKIAAVLSALMFAVVMVGCSGSGVKLDRDVSADGVSWKVPGSWVEKVDEFAPISSVMYSYSNGEDLMSDDYKNYAIVTIREKPTDTPEEIMEKAKDSRSTNPNIESDEITELSSEGKNGAQVSTYENKKMVRDGDSSKESISYEGFVTMPGKIMVEVNCSTDKTTFDAIMNSVKVS